MGDVKSPASRARNASGLGLLLLLHGEVMGKSMHVNVQADADCVWANFGPNAERALSDEVTCGRRQLTVLTRRLRRLSAAEGRLLWVASPKEG
jgi:hypothetical protein